MKRNCYWACIGHSNGEVVGATLMIDANDLYKFQEMNLKTLTLPGTDKEITVTFAAYGRTVDEARTKAMHLVTSNYMTDIENSQRPRKRPVVKTATPFNKTAFRT